MINMAIATFHLQFLEISQGKYQIKNKLMHLTHIAQPKIMI
jgi:hypothetical protein